VTVGRSQQGGDLPGKLIIIVGLFLAGRILWQIPTPLKNQRQTKHECVRTGYLAAVVSDDYYGC